MNPGSSCTRCGSPASTGILAGQCPGCLARLAFAPAPASTPQEFPGFGDYQILREIGRGGMGVVFEALQTSLHRRVAIKMLLTGVWLRPGSRERLHSEAAAAARLRHPGIVTVHEVGDWDGQPFLAMELVEGPSLADLVRQHPLPAARAARYLRLVALAVAHAHAAGVLHRDLKPSNILLDPDDQPRVTDFGLAKQLDTDQTRTRPGELIGSPAYLPPEQIQHGSSSTAGDIYSLGAVLYELLTGRPPFAADTVAAVLHQVANEQPVAPRWLHPGIPRDLETICLKCLRKEPGRRYPTVAAFAEDIARFENGQPIRARSISFLGRAWLWSRRNPALATVSALLIAVFLSGFAGVFLQGRQARDSRDAMSRNLYAADVAAASHALAEGNVGRARSLLQPHLPPMKDPGLPAPEFTLRLLWNRCRGDDLEVLGELPSIVTTVAVSPDGNWVAAGSQDRPGNTESTLLLWNRQHPRRPPVPLPLSNTVWSVAFSHDNRLLISSGAEGTRFWDVAAARAHPDFPTLPGAECTLSSNHLVLSPNHPFFRTTNPAPLIAFDLASRQSRPLDIRGWHPALSPDATRLAILDPDLDIELFSYPDPHPLATVATNNLQFRLRFSPDGNRLVAAGQSTSARVWNLIDPTGPPLRFPSDHNVWDAAFLPDGSSLATATSHQHIELWNLRNAQSRGALVGHTSEVWVLASTPDGRNLLSGSKDRSVRLWPTSPRPGPSSLPASAQFHPRVAPDGRRLLVLSPDGATAGAPILHEWPASGPPTGALPRALGPVLGHAVGIAPDNLHVLVLDQSGTRLEWKASHTAAAVRTVPLSQATPNLLVALVQVSGDGRFLLCPDSNGTFHRWDTRDGRHGGSWSDPGFSRGWTHSLERGTPPDRMLRASACDRSGRWLALGPFGGEGGLLIDLDSGRSVGLRGHHDDIAALAFAPDASFVASGSLDGTIRLWSIPDGTPLAVMPGHLEAVEAIDVSPDGQTLVSATVGVEVTFWHIPTLRELARIAHPDVAGVLRFTPDGRRLLLAVSKGGNDRGGDRLEIWEAP